VGRLLLFWSPRILSIGFAVFVSLFALDVFQEAHGFRQTALALSIHLIPTAIIVAVLLVAWRWEWVGAVLYAAAAGCYMWRVLPAHPSWALVIAGPLLVVAALFLANWIWRPELRTTR
jgi:zinc transporter ZupT